MRFSRASRSLALALACAAVVSVVSEAHAYTDPGYFYKPAHEGGSEGRWFTGSPADGYGCGVCHSGKPEERLVVEGLPLNGYVPGETYQIRIAWPDVANRTRMLYDTQPADMLPRASLVAEMVSESGEDSGRITQGLLKDMTPPELCHIPNVRRFGWALYRQTLDTDPRVKTVSACDGKNFTRCFVTVRGCGAEEVRFAWTAPSRYQGAIWFSLGFVATDRISMTPEEDAVTEITIPIAPAGSSGYVGELQQSCSIASLSPGGGRVPTVVAWCVVFAVAAFRWRRRRNDSRGGCK